MNSCKGISCVVQIYTSFALLELPITCMPEKLIDITLHNEVSNLKKAVMLFAFRGRHHCPITPHVTCITMKTISCS